MANKYQEALDFLDNITKSYKDDIKDFIHHKEIYTLQELIDNYIELVNEKCKKCGDFNIITKIEPLTILCKEKGCKWYGK